MKRKSLLTMLHCLLVLSLALLPSLEFARPVVASASASTASTLSSVQQQVQTVSSTVYGSQPQGSTNSVASAVYSTVYSASKQFSVKSFGAVGDGHHDDTAAIQSAVNYVANLPGAVAFFPQGTYLISNRITIPSNTSLLGIGASSVIMGSASMGTGSMLFVDTSTSARQNISIANLTLNGVSNLPGFLGNTCIRIDRQNLTLNSPGYGFNNISITNNTFQNCFTAIAVCNVLASGAVQSNLTISGNKVYNTTRFGFGEIGNVNNLTISNNTLANIGHDPNPNMTFWDAIYAQNGSNITITNNTISNFGDDAIEVGHYPYASNVPAPSNVNITNNNIEQSTGGANSGDGILISGAANVNISNNTISDINMWGIHVRDSSYTGDNIPTIKVTIQSNTIEHTTMYDGISICLSNYGAIPDNNFTVSNNTIADIAGSGISINNNQNIINNEYTISNNNINNCSGNFINALSGGGTISGNICNNSQQDGLYTAPGVENMTINSNQVYAYGLSQSNRYHGILAMDGANSVFSSNKINSQTNIAYVGISVHNASNTSSKVTYNTISHASIAIYSTSLLNIINNNTDTLTATNVAVTGVAINKTSDTITAGNTDTLTATISPANATNQAVTWTTSNASVATVAGGVVTAVAAGNATITVTSTDGSKTATCAVTVQAASALARLTIAGTIPTMSVGGNTINLKGLALAGTDQYGNSFSLTSLTPTWAVASGASYASLIGTTMTPVAVGSGTVTATIGSVTSNALPFTVTPPTITVSPNSIPPAKAGTSYSQAFTASGGTGPYTYTESGTLPTGIAFANGTLAGKASKTGAYPITITATDANKFTGTESLTLAVAVSH